jgi:hypothetical protein
VARILRRHQIPCLAECDPLTASRSATKATAVRYERSRPGDLVHMDVKKIGKIPPAAVPVAVCSAAVRWFAARRKRAGIRQMATRVAPT